MIATSNPRAIQPKAEYTNQVWNKSLMTPSFHSRLRRVPYGYDLRCICFLPSYRFALAMRKLYHKTGEISSYGMVGEGGSGARTKVRYYRR